MLLYQPPPLDAAGLRILRAMRELGFSTWREVGSIRDLGFVVWREVRSIYEGHDEVFAMLEHSSTEIGQRSPMRGYVEIRRSTRPLPLLRGIGRACRQPGDRHEARITSVGLAECDRTDA